MFFFFFTVKEKTSAIIERFGRFRYIAGPGLHLKMPIDRVAGRVSLQVQQMDVHVETKTLDDVFVRIAVAVQFYVMSDRVREAFYELAQPRLQIEAYVYDEVRAKVPKMKLDDVFQCKDDIADAVREGLSDVMQKYGYAIVKALVNDIDPDAKVKAAMNEINAAQRLRAAAEQRAEGEKILRVKGAEAERDSKILQGEGIAGQRRAIVEGLRESVEQFQAGIPGVTPGEVMQLVLMTQYFDTLKEIGASARTNTVLLPHSPGALGSFAEQIQSAMMMASMTVDASHGKGAPPAEPPPLP